MKKIILFFVTGIFVTQLFAQKKLQTLLPAKLGIFKNGTYFVKREGQVTVTEKSFYIKAPDRVLLGTYWIFVGKETSLHSLVIKSDTFKISNNAKSLSQFLEANIGQNITLLGNAQNTDIRKLSGRLVDYNATTATMQVATSNGKTVIANSENFGWLETDGTPKKIILNDSIIPIAKVKLNNQVDNALVSAISLERGVQWSPSYLFTVINDKEAKLEMKATIANGETEFLQMPVDIIIGNPEMFYGLTMDPVCIDYLNESLLGRRYDNRIVSSLNGSNMSMQSVSNSNVDNETNSWDNSNEEPGKAGQKLDDLYYYQLGVIDLEKNSKVIVPVMTANVAYSEIYTANLPLNSTELEGVNSVQTIHSYLIKNNTAAPLTSGPVLVMNPNGQPLAQSQLNYTAVKSNSELQLSKAVDVQVKNEETETARERSNLKRNATEFYEKVIHTGTINISNFKDKKITLRVSKRIDGIFMKADNNGKSKKIITKDDDDTFAELYWQVEVEAGAKMQLQYSYYDFN